MVSTLTFGFVSTYENKNLSLDRTVSIKSTKIFDEDFHLYFSPQHNLIYKNSIELFKANKLFGIGPKIFRVRCKEFIEIYPNSCSTHPHNTYLQFAVSLGIVGLLFIFSLFIYFYSYYLRGAYLIITKKIETNKINYYYSVIISIAFVINLFPLAPSVSFFNNFYSLLIYTPLPIFLHLINKNSRVLKC